jgi:hypothetical protein
VDGADGDASFEFRQQTNMLLFSSPGVCEQREAAPEETEQLVVRRLPFNEAYRMAESGEITDSMSVAAILKVKLMLLQGQLSIA